MDPNQVTLLLERSRQGDENAVNLLVPLVYDELRRLAHSYLRGQQQTIQATALVNEAYIKLIEAREQAINNRAAAALLVGFFWWRSVWVERQLLAIVDETHRTTAAAPQSTSIPGALRLEWQARLSAGFAHASGALAIAEGLRSAGDYAAAAKILAGLDHGDGAVAIVRVLTRESALAMDLGKLEYAAQCARRAISLDASTGSGESAIQCAYFERRLGRLAEARTSMNQAIARIGRWGDAAYFDELARILEDSGDVTQALKAADSALQREKDSREYQSRWGQLLEASGRTGTGAQAV